MATFLGTALPTATAGVEQNRPTLTLKPKTLQYFSFSMSCIFFEWPLYMCCSSICKFTDLHFNFSEPSLIKGHNVQFNYSQAEHFKLTTARKTLPIFSNLSPKMLHLEYVNVYKLNEFYLYPGVANLALCAAMAMSQLATS